MDIFIEEEAKQYIKENGLKTIYLTIVRCQSWSGYYYQPAVGEGRPEESYKENYFRYMVDGLEVFVRDDVKSRKEGLTVYLGSYRFEPKLFVKGMI